MTPPEVPPSQRAQQLADLRVRLRQAWRILKRGRSLVLGCILLSLVPTVLYLTQVTPLYTAEVKLIIEDTEASEMVTLDRVASMRQRPTESIVLTEAEVLGSNALARRLVERLKLDNDPEFNLSLREPTALEAVMGWLRPANWLPASWGSNGENAVSTEAAAEIKRARIVQRLMGRIKVTPQRRSFIITLQVTSESREKAALLANTLAEVYLDDRLETSFEKARRVTSWLGERLETLHRDVINAESAAEQYRATYNLRRQVDKNDRRGSVNDQQLSELNSRLIIARTELAQKQARLDQIRSLIRTHGSVETSVDVLQSLLIQRLREQETTMLREISEASKVYGERHPKIVGLRADLEGLRAKIDQEINKISASVANEVDVAATGVRTMQAELEGLKSRSNEAGVAELKLRELERQSEVSKGLYEAFLQRFKRDADQEQVQRANARVIARATIPLRPSSPRKAIDILMALCSSLAVGVALVFLLDRLDNAVRSADEAEELTGLPVLSVIPHVRDHAPNLLEELSARPRSALADAFRSARVIIDQGDGEDRDAEQGKPQVIMVTSSVPKEGKTFASLGLATAFTRVEDSVLLVDADLHKPKLHTALAVDGSKGLAQLLAGEASLDDGLVQHLPGGLHFLPAGHFGPVADLAKEPQIQALMAELRKRYGRVLVDLPPALAVADPRIFGRAADRIIYLIKWNSTPRDAILSGLKLLHDADVTVHGTVLSQTDQRKYQRYAYGDYGNYYGRYKEYYSE